MMQLLPRPFCGGKHLRAFQTAAAKVYRAALMKLTRYQDSNGKIHFAADGKRVDGDVFGTFTVPGETADVRKAPAPVAPASILCIGLNYRQHAQETGAKIPETPILFIKQPAAVQNPGDPILLPTHLRADEVDYECELAVVIGKRCK